MSNPAHPWFLITSQRAAWASPPTTALVSQFFECTANTQSTALKVTPGWTWSLAALPHWAILDLLALKKKSRFHVCACPDPDLSLFPPTVPSDVFFINSVWKGYYEYLGKRQPATLTVDWFNATSSKVNATFTAASQVQLELTGRKEDLKAHFLTKVVWALPSWNVVGVLSDCGLCLLVFLSGDYGEWYRNETPSFFFPQNCMYDLLN